MDDEVEVRWIDGDLLRCSLCGQWNPRKARVATHRSATICAECLDLCDQIIAEEQAG